MKKTDKIHNSVRVGVLMAEPFDKFKPHLIRDAFGEVTDPDIVGVRMDQTPIVEGVPIKIEIKVASTGRLNPCGLESMNEKLAEALDDFDPYGDWILLTPQVSSMFLLTLASHMFQNVGVLIFDASSGNYVKRRFSADKYLEAAE